MTNSAFIRGDLIDDHYHVDFFLYEDDIAETYRVKTNKNELKYLKLIKSECTSILEVEALKEALGLLDKNTHHNILSCSELQTLRVKGQSQYYFIHDFVHGESLKQRLDRDISVAVYDACKIIRGGFDILSNAGMPSTQVLTPNDIFINYLDEKGGVSIFPLDLTRYIKHTESSIPRYSLAYQSREAEHNTDYSLATLLYRCLFGFLPWQYDIEWTATYKAVEYQVFSYRDANPLSQSTFHSQYIPDDLKSIVFQALNNIGVNEFSKKLDLFLKRYYEFPYYDDIKLPNSETRNIKLKVSEGSQNKSEHVGLNKVAGMMDLKSLLITDIIEPLKNKQAYKKYGIDPLNGLLFYGPPGCGKTFIAKQLAAELGYTFFEIKPSDLASVYVHGTQEKIGKLFLEASLKAPSVIFIDEVDAVMPSRDSAHMGQHYSSEVNEFLAQLTKCSEKGILTIMATNRPDAIDKAILRTGRVDKAVYIPLPDFDTRKEMLEILLEGRPVDKGLDVDSIAMLMTHYTSSDINYMVNEAAKLALKERSKIDHKHLTEVLHKTKSSVNYDQLEKYDSFTDFQRF